MMIYDPREDEHFDMLEDASRFIELARVVVSGEEDQGGLVHYRWSCGLFVAWHVSKKAELARIIAQYGQAIIMWRADFQAALTKATEAHARRCCPVRAGRVFSTWFVIEEPSLSDETSRGQDLIVSAYWAALEVAH